MTRTKALLLCALLVPSLVAAADDETRLFIDKNPNTGVELYIIDQGGTSSRYDFWILRTVKDGRDLTGRLGNVAHPKDRLEGAAIGRSFAGTRASRSTKAAPRPLRCSKARP
mgnify:CR=1 FL=1